MCIKLNFTESLSIEPSLRKINEVLELFEDFLKNFNISNAERMKWNLCVMEVLSNAVKHGGDPEKRDLIEISWKYGAGEIKVTIFDSGTGPCTSYIESPNLPDDIIAESGRGLYIVNTFVDVWLHRKSLEGYSQTLIKFTK